MAPEKPPLPAGEQQPQAVVVVPLAAPDTTKSRQLVGRSTSEPSFREEIFCMFSFFENAEPPSRAA